MFCSAIDFYINSNSLVWYGHTFCRLCILLTHNFSRLIVYRRFALLFKWPVVFCTFTNVCLDAALLYSFYNLIFWGYAHTYINTMCLSLTFIQKFSVTNKGFFPYSFLMTNLISRFFIPFTSFKNTWFVSSCFYFHFFAMDTHCTMLSLLCKLLPIHQSMAHCM